MAPLTSDVHIHSATLTLRFIRNFEYRTIRYFVLRNIDLTQTTAQQLLDTAHKIVETESGFRPYKTVNFNAMKVYSQAHETKTQNLAINFNHDDELFTDPQNLTKTLDQLGVKNETELSVYNLEAYLEFKQNPVMKW